MLAVRELLFWCVSKKTISLVRDVIESVAGDALIVVLGCLTAE